MVLCMGIAGGRANVQVCVFAKTTLAPVCVCVGVAAVGGGACRETTGEET